MSAFKGTPGPWFAGEQCKISGWVDIRIPGYSRNPVAAATPAASGDAESRRDSETLANARLIAAAPELLEALAGFIAAVEDDGEPTPGARWHAEYVAARAAIAKATGEQA